MPKVKGPTGFLAQALARKRIEVELARAARPLEELAAIARARGPARPWSRALAGPGVGVIAEIKRASPSAGELARDLDASSRARAFEERGAAAISVLTDAAFDGRLADLEAVATAVSVPVLRKDFLVDPWQIWESRAAGADAALVILAALDQETVEALEAEAAEAGLELLVEIHDPAEIERAVALESRALGVNARDLSTLDVDVDAALSTLEALGRAVQGRVLVAESGIANPEDIRRARAAGADAVLVGEHLSRAPDPGRALERLVAAAREGA